MYGGGAEGRGEEKKRESVCIGMYSLGLGTTNLANVRLESRGL